MLPTGTWGTANAVRVTSSRGGGLIFGGIFNLVSGRTTPVTAPTVSRRGTAWIANIQNGDCIKPWGLPYNALYRIANDAQRPAIDEPPELPSLSQEKLAGIAQKTLTNRTVIVLPYTDPTPPAGAPSDGMWRITLFGSSSMDDYRDFVAGQNCGPARATVGTTDVTTQPSNGNNVVNFTTNGVLGGGNGNNATPQYATSALGSVRCASPTRP